MQDRSLNKSYRAQKADFFRSTAKKTRTIFKESFVVM